jgi:DNA-binding NarL/FixJ family response regulator
MIRLAIAEEHAIVRWGLREAFARIPDTDVVGEAATAAGTLDMIHRVKPDVLLLDLSLPDPQEPDLLKEIRELESGPLVVVLASRNEPVHGARAIAAGAHGFVRMSAEPDELVEAIRAVARGERVAPADVEALLAAGDGHPAAALTKREMQVMEMIARGMTNREIARDLEISVKTVDTHRGHIIKKLGVRNNADLTRFAVRHGYVTA